MPSYRVELAQTVVEAATLYIEATDALAAQELAMAIAEGRASTIPPIRWEFADAHGDIDIIGCELLPDASFSPKASKP
jgi:hypothetical protein